MGGTDVGGVAIAPALSGTSGNAGDTNFGSFQVGGLQVPTWALLAVVAMAFTLGVGMILRRN